MKKPRVQVSDHAVLRYLERAGGFDIERLRQQIGHRVEAGHQAGASSVIVDGVAFVIVGDVVVTTLEVQTMLNRQPKSRARK